MAFDAERWMRDAVDALERFCSSQPDDSSLAHYTCCGTLTFRSHADDCIVGGLIGEQVRQISGRRGHAVKALPPNEGQPEPHQMEAPTSGLAVTRAITYYVATPEALRVQLRPSLADGWYRLGGVTLHVQTLGGGPHSITADGGPRCVVELTEGERRALCAVLRLPDIADDPDVATALAKLLVPDA